MTLNDRLVELGSLSDNKYTAPQQQGARMLEAYINTFSTIELPDTNETAHLLYYLTDIQVRDYVLGLMNPAMHAIQVPALEYLVTEAPADTEYVDAPTSILAALYYELDDIDNAEMSIELASDGYSLANLLRRVFASGWPANSFAQMRAELHPKVTAGIFGKDN